MLNQAIGQLRPIVTNATMELQGLLVVELSPAFLTETLGLMRRFS